MNTQATAPPRMPPAPGREAPIASLRAHAYRIPTEKPEADGTFAWDATTLVVVEAAGGGAIGLGYSYTGESAVPLVCGTLADAASGYDAMDPQAAWRAMTPSTMGIPKPISQRGMSHKTTSSSRLTIECPRVHKTRLMAARTARKANVAKKAVSRFSSGRIDMAGAFR